MRELKLLEDNLLLLPKQTLELLLLQEKPAEAITLYLFYLYNTKWYVSGNDPFTIAQTKEKLGWGEKKIRDTKKVLENCGLITIAEGNTTKNKPRQALAILTVPDTEKDNILYTVYSNIYNTIYNIYNTIYSYKAVSSNKAVYSNNTNTTYDLAKNDTLPGGEAPPLDKKSSPELPLQGSTPIRRLVGLYSRLWKKKYGTSPNVNWAKVTKILSPYLKDFSEYRLAMFIMVYFNWKGANGDDFSIEKRLQSNCYPLEWVHYHFNAMSPYIKNTLGIDIDNTQQVEKIVNNKIKELE